MVSSNTLKKIRKSINDSIKNFKYYREIDGRNCYMHTLKIDMNVNDIFPDTKKFEVGCLSDTFKYMRTNEELEEALYSDMSALGLSCIKEEDESLELLNENEWKIALYQTSKPIMLKGGIPCKCCHLIRQDYNSKKWTQKSGMNSPMTVASRGTKGPKDLKLSFTYNGEKVYYDYVGTYKISTIKKIASSNLINLCKSHMKVVKVKLDNFINRNCYMYALNIDVDKDIYVNDDFSFAVGDFSGTYHIYEDEEDLENSFLMDMNVLGQAAIKVDPHCELLNENEWKVALYYRKDINGKYRDFHFVKQVYGDDKWYHKKGGISMPTFKDDSGVEILNPEDAKISCGGTDYEYVATYKLSVK